MKSAAAVALAVTAAGPAVPILDTSFVLLQRLKYGLPLSADAITSTTAS